MENNYTVKTEGKELYTGTVDECVNYVLNTVRPTAHNITNVCDGIILDTERDLVFSEFFIMPV